jgi:hypothetical protein
MPDKNLRAYVGLLREPVKVDRSKSAPKCRMCPYYHPDFKYRRCLFATCPYGKGDDVVFRAKPLTFDRFSSSGGR